MNHFYKVFKSLPLINLFMVVYSEMLISILKFKFTESLLLKDFSSFALRYSSF